MVIGTSGVKHFWLLILRKEKDEKNAIGNFRMRQRKENVCVHWNVEIDGGKRRKLELQTSDRSNIFLWENEEEAVMSGFYDSQAKKNLENQNQSAKQ